ncbi:MAG: tagaturonate reductase [Bacteroidota bacterium]
MKKLNRKNTGITEKLPIKIIQFGEGNFLRAFVNYIIDKLNEEAGYNAGVVVVQPISTGLVEMLNDQDGLYNLFMRGIKDNKEIQEKRLITCIQNGIDPYKDYQSYLDLAKEEELGILISNTTEAGIAYDENDRLDNHPHNSFPAKVTALLWERFNYFNRNKDKGLAIIPCELINYNANTLKEIILKYSDQWELGDDFVQWINKSNSFHNTLVDRIVPGYPRAEIKDYQKQLEYEDKLIVTAEVFLLWVIEGDQKLKQKIPFTKIDENIMVVKDMQPYRTRKVRILNGAHTAMVPFSLMYGNETVKETIDNEFTGKFIRNVVFEEINKTLDLSEEELNSFASEVFDRFRNPFIKHQLSSIALNSVSKFKVRVLPSLLAYNEKYNELPPHLTYAFACLIRFYKGAYKGKELPVQDDMVVKEFFSKIWEGSDYRKIAQEVLQKKEYWDIDLTTVTKLEETIAFALEKLDQNGVEEGYKAFTAKQNI